MTAIIYIAGGGGGGGCAIPNLLSPSLCSNAPSKSSVIFCASTTFSSRFITFDGIIITNSVVLITFYSFIRLIQTAVQDPNMSEGKVLQYIQGSNKTFFPCRKFDQKRLREAYIGLVPKLHNNQHDKLIEVMASQG